MSNHIADTSKKVSDTPRMDQSSYDDGAIWETGCDIERELNAANDRIKRLEEAGDELLAALQDDWSEYIEWINESTDAVGKWKRAKEAKP